MWLRAKTSLLLLFIATAQAADTADALPTLFDFLGAMVEQEGGWVDPLHMDETFQELESEVVDGANASQGNGTASVATQVEPRSEPDTKTATATGQRPLGKELP